MTRLASGCFGRRSLHDELDRYARYPSALASSARSPRRRPLGTSPPPALRAVPRGWRTRGPMRVAIDTTTVKCRIRVIRLASACLRTPIGTARTPQIRSVYLLVRAFRSTPSAAAGDDPLVAGQPARRSSDGVRSRPHRRPGGGLIHHHLKCRREPMEPGHHKLARPIRGNGGHGKKPGRRRRNARRTVRSLVARSSPQRAGNRNQVARRSTDSSSAAQAAATRGAHCARSINLMTLPNARYAQPPGSARRRWSSSPPPSPAPSFGRRRPTKCWRVRGTSTSR